MEQKSPLRRKPKLSELLVAKTPGHSSSGFANTFRILENQIKRKQFRYSSLVSISEEEPSVLELELAARSRLAELCDTSVFKSEATISLNKHKLDHVQNYIYHVTKGKNGDLTVKSKHLPPTSSVTLDDDDYGKLNCLLFHSESFCLSIFAQFILNVAECFEHMFKNNAENIRFSNFPLLKTLD